MKEKRAESELGGTFRNFGVQSEDGLQLLGGSWGPTETPIMNGVYTDEDPLPEHCKLLARFEL